MLMDAGKVTVELEVMTVVVTGALDEDMVDV